MTQGPVPRPPDAVRVVVDDVPEIIGLVREAARRALGAHRPVELVEPPAPEGDHDARARIIRRMDEALEVARRAAPGVQVRVGFPIELPRPRHAS